MSDPSGENATTPAYAAYDAPAYGDVAPDDPTLSAGPPPEPRSAPLTPPLAAPGGNGLGDPYSAPTPPGPPPPPGPGWTPYPGSPSGPAPYQLPPRYLVNPAAPTHSLATTSLVLGIIGLVSALLTPLVLVTIIGVICSPFAIWLSVRARREIAANPQAWSGTGAATAGLVTGIIGLVLGVLFLLVVLALVILFASLIASLG